MAFLTIFANGVELALHNVELFVDRWKAFWRLNKNQAVHSIGYMHADRRSRAVIDEQTLVQSFETEYCFVTWRSKTRRCAATGPGYRVQINIMRHF